MPAHHNVNPHQLKLFMGGREWQDTMSDSVDRMVPVNGLSGESMGQLWDRKLVEAKQPAGTSHGAGLHESLSEHGYEHDAVEPPTIFHGDLWGQMEKPGFAQGEGHHRIAAAADIEKTTGKNVWIPTKYEASDGDLEW